MRAPGGGRPTQHVCGPTTWRCLTSRDAETSIGERFRTQVGIHPDCLAVKDGELALSYVTLDAWAGAIADRLEDAAVLEHGRVVQLLHQGAASVASTLGTLMAGATHVPLDPDEPDARLRALLGRVGPSAIVTDEAGAARLAGLGVEVSIVLADECHYGELTRAHATTRARTTTPDSIATIYFTSGSTGAPKGVIDRHRNIVHNTMRYTLALGITPTDWTCPGPRPQDR